jgi:L-ascorbate metabolism protein UlaG (beta-lactamase superfamily)
VPGLVDEIAGHVPEHGVSVWWLGQSGVIIRGRSATVAIDPFLSDYGHFGRLYEPPFSPGAVGFLDLLLGTHDHADHIDPLGFPQLLAASPGALGVVPAAVLEAVAARVESPERLTGASVGMPVEHAGVRATPIPAVHAAVPADGYGLHLDEAGEHPFLGYLVELDGVRLCHTGDTLVYPGLAKSLRDADLDLLLLPINGASWFREQRGLVGNMNVHEAAELAELSGARLVVPMHWDLFADNTEDPAHFVRYAAARHPGATVLVPEVGARLDLRPAG